MKWDPFHIPYAKVKIDQQPKCKSKIIKQSSKSLWSWFGTGFLALATKEKK